MLTQLGKLKPPSVSQVAVPPPEYPTAHVTVRVSPVTPVMLPVAEKSELATSVAVHAFAEQEVPLPL
jgi:hypothetical protein